MRIRFPLRYQLLIVSLCLLVLPVGAWQYLKAIDYAIRVSQEQTLKDTALQLARRLSANPDAFVLPYVTPQIGSQSLYVYPLSSTPIVDGYGDEWRYNRAQTYTLGNDQFSASLQWGAVVNHNNIATDNELYLYVQVADRDRQYFNPSRSTVQAALLQHDHIRLTVYDVFDYQQVYYVRASAPGTVLVQRQQEGQWVSDNRIRGFWREAADGYQIELMIEKQLLQEGFDFSVVSAPDQQQPVEQTIELHQERTELVMLSSQLQQQLANAPFPSVTTKLVSEDYWLLAMQKENKVPVQQRATYPPDTNSSVTKNVHWLLEWFYRRLLLSGDFLVRQHNPYLSYQTYPELAQAAQTGVALQWYRKGDERLYRQTLASAAAPVVDQGQVLAYVVVEKTTDQLVALTTSAFGVLFFYTVGASVLVALILLLYASWLSLRISRLSRAATTTINEQGHIALDHQHWPDSRGQDELGDLSRSYQQLLQRVHEYNDYLRTLSSKLSHELRTPIAVVRSSLENLEQVQQNINQQKIDQKTGAQSQDSMGQQYYEQYYQRAYEGIERLHHILNAMSAATRLEDSLHDAEFAQVSLNDFVGELMTVYQDVYPTHIFEFYPAAEDKQCRIARELFVQMLDKLVENAVGFCEAQSPIVVRLQNDKKLMTLYIENKGSLLPENMQQSLFEPMISVRDKASCKNTDNEQATNTQAHLGMGLYIVRLIGQVHQADVFACNLESGDGVMFSVALPINP